MTRTEGVPNPTIRGLSLAIEIIMAMQMLLIFSPSQRTIQSFNSPGHRPMACQTLFRISSLCCFVVTDFYFERKLEVQNQFRKRKWRRVPTRDFWAPKPARNPQMNYSRKSTVGTPTFLGPGRACCRRQLKIRPGPLCALSVLGFAPRAPHFFTPPFEIFS